MHEGARSVVQAPTQDTIRLLIARGIFMVSGYFVSVILARGLGPLEYGVYGVIISVLMWIEMVGSAGVPAAIAQLLPEHQSQMPQVEQAARLLLLSSSLLLFAISWWVAPTLANLFDMPSGTVLFRLAILDIPLSGVYCAYQGILSGHRRFGSQGLAFMIYGLTKLSGHSDSIRSRLDGACSLSSQCPGDWKCPCLSGGQIPSSRPTPVLCPVAFDGPFSYTHGPLPDMSPATAEP